MTLLLFGDCNQYYTLQAVLVDRYRSVFVIQLMYGIFISLLTCFVLIVLTRNMLFVCIKFKFDTSWNLLVVSE